MWTIFLKESRDVLKSRYFLALGATLTLVVALSLLISAIDFRQQLSDFNNYVQAIKQSGGTVRQTPPQLSPLQQLRGSFEYIEIIGAILAIIVGYGTIAKEKYRGTLRLLFSRPAGPLDIAAGKLAALATVWFLIIVCLSLVILAMLRLVGGAALSSSDAAKIGLSLSDAWVYLMFWSSLSMGLASFTKQLGTALLVSFVIWMGFVLIIAQIGDTMDPDNQVPGGLFHSLQVDKPHEQAVMTHFGTYETARNALEESSISKHFERASFAFLGIKKIYDQQPVAVIWHDTWKDTALPLAAAGLGAAFALLQCNKRNLTGRKEK